VNGEFRGLVATVVNLGFLQERLKDSSQGGLVAYVVDGNGRLVVHPDSAHYTPGQDMRSVPIVQMFLEGTSQASLTTAYQVEESGRQVDMLGTQVAVPELNWAVVAEKPIDVAYTTVYEMERYAFLLGLVTILFSIGISAFLARRLTAPLHMLTETTHAIARGDFSRRIQISSRTEIGDLAETFNLMTDDLEKYVEQLKQAAHENHELSWLHRTLAAAIDEKDPYTRALRARRQILRAARRGHGAL
jgi:methyl-accepting chemotaxis protein